MAIQLESRRTIITDRLILMAIIIMFLGLLLSIINNCIGQETEPAAPADLSELLYTIDRDTGLEVFSIIPAGTDWVPLPITEHSRIVLSPGAQVHGFYHIAGTTPTWYVPIPGGGSAQYMKIVADDSGLDGMFVFRARAQLTPVNPDGTPSSVVIPAVRSWWVARLPAFLGRIVFGQ